jgi:hypothetical protein
MGAITLENVCTRGDAWVPAVIVRNRAGEVHFAPVLVALTAPAGASGRAAESKGAIQVGRAAPKFPLLVACLMIIMIVISTSILF